MNDNQSNTTRHVQPEHPADLTEADLEHVSAGKEVNFLFGRKGTGSSR